MMKHDSNVFERVISSLKFFLPLLPVAGFVLALIYEYAFFLTIGIDARDVLRLSDLAEASAFTIIPLLPILVLAIVFASSDKIPRLDIKFGRSERTKISIIRIVLPAAIFFFGTIVYASFGYHWYLGPITTIIAISALLFNIFVFSKLGEILFYVLPMLGIVFLSMLLPGVWGTAEARLAIYGKQSRLIPISINSHLPHDIPKNARLIRRLASGIIITDQEMRKTWFIPEDSSYFLSVTNEEKPFPGLICIFYNYCPEIFAYERPD